jgi:hypothetical protein
VKDIATVKAHYNEKAVRFWTGTFKEPDIPEMQGSYGSKMDIMNAKQLLAIDVCNENSVPVARRASFLMFTNFMTKLTVFQNSAGSAAIKDAIACIAYMTVQFGWSPTEVTTAEKISEQVFSVDIPE